MKILYIARKFPPYVGGMERAAKELYDHLALLADVKLVKPKVNARTPLSVPILFVKSIWQMLVYKPDIIFLQDGMLSPLIIVGKVFSVPVVVQIHGLDITFNKYGYQQIVLPFLRIADRIICGSNATKEECLIKKIKKPKIVVIPCGIEIEYWELMMNENQNNGHSLTLPNNKYILSVGRLIERKGFHWFIQEVLPKVWVKHPDVSYVLVGDGVMKKPIEEIVNRFNLGDKVLLLGKINNNDLATVYQKASVFVSPNIHVEGDKEGFGITNVEAAFFNLPIVASKVDGIPDAVIEGVTGSLIEPYNSIMFADRINCILDGIIEPDKVKIKQALISKFSWDGISKAFLKEFYNLVEIRKKYNEYKQHPLSARENIK